MQDSLDFLYNIRAMHWGYPVDITDEEIEQTIKRFAEAGVNLLLAEDHRYIMYDLPLDAKSQEIPHFHFKPQNYEASIHATRRVVESCHRNGIKFLQHITCCYCSEDFKNDHADWTQRDIRRPDAPLYFGDYGGVWLLCLNHPEFRNAFYDRVIDYGKRTGVDGWMVDEVEWLPDWFSCGCKHCVEKFLKETGHELPRDEHSPIWENFEDPIWRAWLRFRMKSAGDLLLDLKKRLDEELPGQVLTACHAGASDTWSAQLWGCDVIELERANNLIFYEAYIRNGVPFYSWRWYLSEMRLYSALARWKGHPPMVLFYPVLYYEQEFCWALSALAGHRLWTPTRTKLKTGFPNYYVWEREHPFLFGRQTQPASVALVFSKPTRDNYMGNDTGYYVTEWTGWAETLNEANVPYQVITERDLHDEALKSYSLLIVPHTVCLSDDQLNAILTHLDRGGQVILTADAGLRDETGAPRTDLKIVEEIRARSRYFQDKIGQKHYLGFFRMETRYEDKRDVEAGKLMVSSVQELAGDTLPWKLEAPEGVIANGFVLEDGSFVLHILNCQGASLPSGTELGGKKQPLIDPNARAPKYATLLSAPVGEREGQIVYPPAENLRVHLFKKALGEFRNATLYLPFDNEQKNLKIQKGDSEASVEIDQLESYAIVHLTR